MIAQRLTKPVEIAFAGQRWRILFTHRVLLDIEELTGQPAMRVNLAQPSAKLLRAALFAALREAGAGLSLGDAGALLRPGAAARSRAALIEAWRASMPDPEPAEVDPPSSAEPLAALDAWAEARYDLRLSGEEWLGMTPRMLRALTKRRLENMRWSELLAGIITAHSVNHSFRAPKDWRTPGSYMPHPWPHTEPERAPVTGETLIAVFADQG